MCVRVCVCIHANILTLFLVFLFICFGIQWKTMILVCKIRQRNKKLPAVLVQSKEYEFNSKNYEWEINKTHLAALRMLGWICLLKDFNLQCHYQNWSHIIILTGREICKNSQNIKVSITNSSFNNIYNKCGFWKYTIMNYYFDTLNFKTDI